MAEVEAQLPPGVGRVAEARRNQARVANGQCPDGSGFSTASDESASSRILGNVTACLRREGVLANRSISVQAVNAFERGCQFAPRAQPLTLGSFSNRLLMDQFFQDLASRSKSQVDCRIDFFNHFFGANENTKRGIHQRFSRAYEAIRTELEPLAAYKNQLEREALLAEASAGSANCMPPYHTGADCVEAAQTGGFSRGTLTNVNRRIASLCVRMPMGYEPEMCEAIVEMATVGSYSPGTIERGLSRAQLKYSAASQTYTNNTIPTSGGHGYICLNDRYRNLALSSGQAEELLATYPASTMDDTTKKVLRCHLRSEYLVSQSRLNWGIGGVVALGVVATIIPTGGSSAVATTAAVTGAVAGVIGFTSMLDEAVQACSRFASGTTDIISGASRACNPEADFSHALEESSLTSCLTNSGLAAVAAVTIPGSLIRIANARRAANPLLNAETSVDEAAVAAETTGDEIVVTATRESRNAGRSAGRSSRNAAGSSGDDVAAASPSGRRPGLIRRTLDRRAAARAERDLQRRLTESPWNDELRAAARADYRATRQNIRVAANGQSPETVLAKQVDAQDLFGYDGFLSVDDAVRAGRFTETAPYMRGGVSQREMWWLDVNVPVANSRSTVVQELVRENGAANVRRTIGWPNSSVSTSGNTTALDRQRYALNEVLERGPDGRQIRKSASLEVISRNSRTGEWEPFLYEWVDGRWVQLRTLQGVPVRQNCIACHRSPTTNRFTPVPYRVVPNAQAMDSIYTSPYTARSYDQFQH